MPITWIRRRRLVRGASLLEILIAVAIMAMIAGAVGVGAYRAYRDSQVRTAAMNARTIRGAVKSYWVSADTGDCPTFADLVRGRALDEDSPRKDPWGTPWRIECSEDRVSVSSDGPDRKSGTDDDIRVPPLTRQSAAADDSS